MDLFSGQGKNLSGNVVSGKIVELHILYPMPRCFCCHLEVQKQIIF